MNPGNFGLDNLKNLYSMVNRDSRLFSRTNHRRLDVAGFQMLFWVTSFLFFLKTILLCVGDVVVSQTFIKKVAKGFISRNTGKSAPKMAMASSSLSPSWPSSLKIRDMKRLLESVLDAEHCVERSELEEFVASQYDSLEQALSALQERKILEDSKKKTAPPLERIKRVLSQDRGELNFVHYTPSQEHSDRLKFLAETAPDLYNSSSITPRSKWFGHKHWNKNSQMPPYHVHFRQELQDVIRYLYEAYYSASKIPKAQLRAIRNAGSLFRGSMRGLNGHVRIEEYACFPLYRRTFPNVDIAFLYQDHEQLHKSEKAVNRAFNVMEEKSQAQDELLERDDILSLLELVLDFDDQLMAHLGEEEEIVVPMSLTDKIIRF
jgi:hypothetical protein